MNDLLRELSEELEALPDLDTILQELGELEIELDPAVFEELEKELEAFEKELNNIVQAP